MNKLQPKEPRLRLNLEEYRQLHRKVLERDNWRCQICSSMQQLEVHHLRFRSHCGGDLEQNLITLCTQCHTQAHRGCVVD